MASGVSCLVRLPARSAIWIGVVFVIAHATASAADDTPARAFRIPAAADLFRSRTRNVLPPAERARVNEIEAIAVFAYEEEFPDAWRTFRESALTRLLERLRSTLVAANPSPVVRVGASATPDASLRSHFQNWRAWLAGRIVDRIPADSSPLTSAQTAVSEGSR